MGEKILLALLGSGNIILFIKFLIERHDRKKERAEDKAEDKAEQAEQKELAGIKDRLTKLEKDGIRIAFFAMDLSKARESLFSRK